MPTLPIRNEVLKSIPIHVRTRQTTDQDIERARTTSTPDAWTIIDPLAAPTRLRRLADGFEVL